MCFLEQSRRLHSFICIFAYCRFSFIFLCRKEYEQHVRSEVASGGVHYSNTGSHPTGEKRLLTPEEEKAAIAAEHKKIMNKLHDHAYMESDKEKERREREAEQKKQHDLAEMQRKLMAKMAGGH